MFGGLTGYSLVFVRYIGAGKLWRIKQWWINGNSLYIHTQRIQSIQHVVSYSE